MPAPAIPSPAVPRHETWAFKYTPGTYTYTITTTAWIAPRSDTSAKRAVPTTVKQVTVAVAGSGDVRVITPPPPPSAGCDTTAALITRAQQLIPKLPEQLAAAAGWADSVSAAGCHGNILTQTNAVRTYTVLGDTTYESVPALHVRRTDTTWAKGDGAEGQHRILLSAVEVGSADLYFDVPGGRFLGSLTDQATVFDVTTSGRLGRFVQHARERVTAVSP